MKTNGLVFAALFLLARQADAQTLQIATSANPPNQTLRDDELIVILRVDPVESRRLQAALLIGASKHNSKHLLAALVNSASGVSVDGYPAENSAHVRMQALRSLQACLCSGAAQNMAGEQEHAFLQSRNVTRTAHGEVGPAVSRMATGILTAYYDIEVAATSDASVIDQAWRFLAESVSAQPVGASVFDQTMLVPRPLGSAANEIVAPWPVVGGSKGYQRIPVAFTVLPAIFKPER